MRKIRKKVRWFYFLGWIVLWVAGQSGAQTTRPHLEFSGNRQIHSADLKKLWPEREKAPDSTAVFNYLQRVLSFYGQKGFYFARVDSFRIFEKRKSPTVKIWLKEGKRLRLKSLRVHGTKVFSENNILDRFATRRGHIFQPERLQNDIERLLARYADRGYPLTRVQVERFRVDSIRGSLSLLLNVAEGPVGRVDSIVVRGNKLTRKKTIVRETGLHIGERFSRRKIQRLPVRLKRLPFLHLSEDVAVHWDSSGKGTVVIPVREENMAHFDGTVGYNPPRGSQKGTITGLIDVSFQNLFGTGRTFSAFWQKKEAQSQEIRLFYREPWIWNRPLSASLHFEQRLQDSTYIRRAWSTGVDFRWLDHFQLSAQIGRETILPDSIGTLLLGIRKSQSLRFSTGLQFDSRDDWLNPRTGVFYQTSVDFLRRRSESQNQSVRRAALDFEGYWNWFGRQVWALALHGRDVRFPGEIVPVEEKFFLGGSRTLRGYREDQFRGSRLAWSNLEYRYLIGPQSRVFLFLDTGWVDDPKSAASGPGRFFKIGYGVGVRLQTTLGIVGLDYGLGEGDSFTQGKIHLRLINRF